MDRVTQLRVEPGGSADNSFSSVISTPPGEAYITANDNTSTYFSLSEEESSFTVSPTKDVSLATAADDSPQKTLPDPDQLISNLAPVAKSTDLTDNFQIGKHIEAANILSGGVDIFDDNDNSYDGDELVIDDNAGTDPDDKSNSNSEGKLINKLDQLNPTDESVIESTLVDGESAIPSKDTAIMLQIDGKNVDAIAIGNGLYLYRREDELEELAAVQIVDNDEQQPTFKFLKVRVNAEGNLEVYEEIEVEVPKDEPSKESKVAAKNSSHLPIKDINKVISDASNKAVDRKPSKEISKESASTITKKSESDCIVAHVDSGKTEVNFNGKTMKFSEARKSPVIGSFTPMTFHSTPNKEGIPLTKTMVDMQLHPNRHSENVKKTIEVNTDSCKQKIIEAPSNIEKRQQRVEEIADDDNLNNDAINNKGKVHAKGEETKSTDPTSVSLTKSLTPDVITSTDKEGTNSPLIMSQTKALTTSTSSENKTGIDIKLPNQDESNHLIEPSENVKLDISKVIEPKPNISIKIEAQSDVTNDFVNKYVNKALIIKTYVKNASDPTKSNDKTNLNMPGKNPNLPSNNAVKKSEQVSQAVDKKNIPRVSTLTDATSRPINNNAVPFGKWTEANKQEYLNKIKETKVTTNNTNQIKQTNDLNRRDVLKKFDSQRQINSVAAAAKTQELTKQNVVKSEKPAFVSKASVKQDINVKSETLGNNTKTGSTKLLVPDPGSATTTKKEPATLPAVVEPAPAAEPQYSTQSLIDRTIEDILMDRRPPPKFNRESAMRQNPLAGKSIVATEKVNTSAAPKKSPSQDKDNTPIDEIEIKMNELHGIPFIERPVHELPLPPRHNKDVKTYSRAESHSKVLPMSKVNKIPPLVPILNKPQPLKTLKNDDTDDLSDEEIIEHEPITGDIDLQKRKITLPQQTATLPFTQTVTSMSNISPKKDGVITENEFDKFARRNSITYENCITVNFESNKQHNVVQGIVEKEMASSKIPRSSSHTESKSQYRHAIPTVQSSKTKTHASRFVPISSEEEYNKNYQSKLQIAYQSAMTAKKHKESSIIEDKPVKVVFMDTDSDYAPGKFNMQGQEVSPIKQGREPDAVTLSSFDSLDSERVETGDDTKSQDVTKKVKHQRKQVLTPVETPDMELIDPNEVAVSPKKKRKIEDNSEKSSKSVLPKKTYLLGRGGTTQDNETANDVPKEHISRREHTTASAIDNLVKAAELLENQSEKLNATADSLNSSQTPVKRGRGRPRKYPLPEGAADKTKSPTPQKKPRVEKKPSKPETSSDEGTTDDEMVRENWTMGKINEKIVCPICNKLFRSENVVFKHVKHCTGPSPSRSGSSDKRSLRRGRRSRDPSHKSSIDSQFEDMDTDSEKSDDVPIAKKIKSKVDSKELQSPKTNDSVILIEDTPVKPRRGSDKREHVSTKFNVKRKTLTKVKNSNDLSCEICGKSFRQLSYLINHKLQHNNDEPKNNESESTSKSSVFSCEVCKKEFRKLHHLVQHRIIHNPTDMSSKLRRKSSAEHSETKTRENVNSVNKPPEDHSAGFRCEPCDKSFRKLHHLVEHRETHDGINRQKNTTVDKTTPNVDKADAPPPQCDVCNKTFRKMHHLIEHKEQHIETGTDKSDDKSVKSALSTKDIIHECALCYMVFPNEHSLNKHTINCQRKKRQPVSKQKKPEADDQTSIDSIDSIELEASEESSSKEATAENSEGKEDQKVISTSSKNAPKRNKSDTEVPKQDNKSEDTSAEKRENTEPNAEVQPPERDVEIKPVESIPVKRPSINNETHTAKPENKQCSEEVPVVIKTPVILETIVIKDTPKKNTPIKDKTLPTVTKRQKKMVDLPAINEVLASDDDDIRYMLNPDFTLDATDAKKFMNVRANKRNSLQIERPNSKDPIKRRNSLQQMSKIRGPKPKTENKGMPTKNQSTLKDISETLRVDPVLSIDSDDSDVKYSFPEPAHEKSNKATSKQDAEKKIAKIASAKTRKSLSGIAKRKSLGKLGTPRQKSKAVPATQVKKRTKEVGHRCDCGQLFNSAALLSRHTSLAHTPPRIRRRRSSPPPPAPTGEVKRPRATPAGKASKPVDASKSSKPVDASKASKPVDASKSSKPVDASKSSKPVDASKSSKPVDASKSSKPVDASKSSKPVDASKASKPVDASKSSKPVDASKSSKPVDASKSSKPVDASKSSKPADASKSSKPVDASKSSKPVDASKSSVKSDAGNARATNSRKSSVKSDANKTVTATTSNKTPRAPSAKTDTKNTETVTKLRVKRRSTAAHSGVPTSSKLLETYRDLADVLLKNS